MTDDSIVRALTHQEDIQPSSGFVLSVMDAVRQEAAAPQPIPFPWLRVLPGMVLMGVILIVLGILATQQAASLTTVITPVMKPAMSLGLGWAALGLLISFASMLASIIAMKAGNLLIRSSRH